jgi:drug/metabolite transporter (DMT)-like permease
VTTDAASAAARGMSHRAWTLFAAMSVIWGIPYLFIKIAVVEMSPVAIVGWRTLIGAVILLPVAARSGAVREALRSWPYVVAFGLIEMAVPWVLLGHAETRVPSGFAGLMLAAVPIVSTVVAWLLGERHAVTRVRLVGLGVGVLGVASLVGLDWAAGTIDPLSVVELLVVATCYAVAPAMAARKLAHVPSMGVVGVSLAVVALLYLPVTVVSVHAGLPSTGVVLSVLVLGLVCTALAFVLFFELIAESGPVRATVITFVNPAVAVALGLVVLGEPLTWGTLVGFPLVLLGSYWATRGPARAAEPIDAATA